VVFQQDKHNINAVS